MTAAIVEGTQRLVSLKAAARVVVGGSRRWCAASVKFIGLARGGGKGSKQAVFRESYAATVISTSSPSLGHQGVVTGRRVDIQGIQRQVLR